MMSNVEARDVIVVGGGQAGLAIGYFLAQQNADFTILEAAAEPTAAWRARWDSLRLFTPVRYNSLPGKAFPGDPDTYPRRDDVVAYLTDYAERFDLPVELGSPVRSINPLGGGGYIVETNGRAFETNQVVIATGPFQVPHVPALAKGLDDVVAHFHSSDYRTPGSIPPGPVLVVGGGNTGFQIAAELAATHPVHLSISARQTPLPQRLLGRDLFAFLDKTGLMNKSVDTRLGQRLKDRETLIGSHPRSLRRRHGVSLHGRAKSADGNRVTFEDDTTLEVSSVIWATGYRLDHSFVHAPVFDDEGAVVHDRGVTWSPGLYFLGLPWLYTRGSALLGWVKDDARFLSERIAEAAPAQDRNDPARRLAVAEPVTDLPIGDRP
jgi:putative flavoprotein involved in K+ transport